MSFSLISFFNDRKRIGKMEIYIGISIIPDSGRDYRERMTVSYYFGGFFHSNENGELFSLECQNQFFLSCPSLLLAFMAARENRFNQRQRHIEALG